MIATINYLCFRQKIGWTQVESYTLKWEFTHEAPAIKAVRNIAKDLMKTVADDHPGEIKFNIEITYQ